MRRLPLFLVCLAAAAAMLGGCGRRSDDTIRIGVIAELTGSIPAVGASCRNAALLAAREINDAGGIEVEGKKKKIELVIEDTAAKADQAAAAAQKLITRDDVAAIVGPNSSSNALPAAEIAERTRPAYGVHFIYKYYASAVRLGKPAGAFK